MTFFNTTASRLRAFANTSFLTLSLIAILGLGMAHNAAAVTVNFSNIEMALANPENFADDATPDQKMAGMNTLWVGWQTQVYEYNMPFIEVANTNANLSISEFRMTIGDTNYQFSNEFLHKDKTNSSPFPANGDYAITGYSTPSIQFTSSIENGGDVLALNFGNGGLKPGEVVRFQVDINADNLDPGMMYFAPYTEVFFNKDGIIGEVEPDNSIVAIEFVEDTPGVSAQIPNYQVTHAVDALDPRDHADMQMIDLLPPLNIIEEVPEPSALILLGIAGIGATLNRRSRNQ